MNSNLRLTPAALSALSSGDLDNFLVAATPGGIEAQEATGQQELVNSSVLPKDMGYNTTREMLESLGIIFGKNVDGLFIECTLPQGWKKVATDHNMWSHLLDDKGRKRASIFYKAAFYDRHADISLECRYHAYAYPEDNNDSHWNGPRVGAVRDWDQTVLWRTAESAPYEDHNKRKELEDQAYTWLNEHYPDHHNPLAYWD